MTARRASSSLRRLASRFGWLAILLALVFVAARLGLFGLVSRDEEAFLIDRAFSTCDQPQAFEACVSDGDSFRLAGDRFRLSGVDAPEIGDPQCEEERRAGFEAKEALASLFNEGPFRFEPDTRARDHYGRRLGRAVRDGEDLGDLMIERGFARPYRGAKSDWCDGAS